MPNFNLAGLSDKISGSPTLTRLADAGKDLINKYMTDPKYRHGIAAGGSGLLALLALMGSKKGNKIRNALMLGLPTYLVGAFGPDIYEYGKKAYGEAKRGYRNARETKKYDNGVGYRRFADELKRARNLPDDTFITKGVSKIFGRPTKSELLDRLNKMDPDKFDMSRYNPVQGTIENNPIDWGEFNTLTGKQEGGFWSDNGRRRLQDRIHEFFRTDKKE